MNTGGAPQFGPLTSTLLAQHSNRLVREVITNFMQVSGYWDDAQVNRLRVIVGMWAQRCAQEGYEHASRERAQQQAGELR